MKPVLALAAGKGIPWSDGGASVGGAGERARVRDKAFREGYHGVWHKVSDCVTYSWRDSQDWSLWDWVGPPLHSARKQVKNGGGEGQD